MKAASRLLKAKHHGTCAICKTRISKGSLIVRLEGRIPWIETKVARYGKRYQVYKTSQYAHGDCWDEYKEAKDESE